MTTMTFNGKTFEVDDEIASIVYALNAAGISTVASCSGHGMRPGRISLADGRELFVLPSYEIGQWFDTQFPRDINGQTKEERADTIRELLAERDALRAERDELLEVLRDVQRERDELQQSFDLHWRASMRAIKRWQEAHPGSDLTWPDHADLVVWLLEQLDAARDAEDRSDE